MLNSQKILLNPLPYKTNSKQNNVEKLKQSDKNAALYSKTMHGKFYKNTEKLKKNKRATILNTHKYAKHNESKSFV